MNWMFIAIVSALFLSNRSPASPPNLIANPAFSGGVDTAIGWSQDVRAGEYHFARRAGGGPNGETTLTIEGPSAPEAGWARWYTRAFLQSGAAYELSVLVRVEGRGRADLWLPDVFEQSVPSGPWHRASVRFTAPSTGSTAVYFQLYGPGTASFARPDLRVVRPAPPLAGSPVPAAGGPIARIVVGPAPDPVALSAALDLRRVFASVTGATIPIGPSASAGRCLYIGCAPAGQSLARLTAGLAPEGIRLRIGPRAIVCLGGGPRGVYYAVQELLSRIGYRSIWPGPAGEVMPPPGPLRLPADLDLRHSPAFAMRGGTVVQVEALPGQQLGHVNTAEWVDWAARNRWNRLKPSYSTTWDYGAERGGEWQETSGHTVTELLLPAAEFARHPEWFALYHGKRVSTHPIGTLPEPCVSNPEVVDHFTSVVREYFRGHPDARRFFIGANDEPSYWCECPRCRALDVGKVDWSKNGRESLPLTDRWLWLVNRVAQRIEKEFPGRWIGTFAYASTREPPRLRRPRRNVMIELTWWDRCYRHRLADPACPPNRRGLALLRKWLRVAPAVSIYSYLDYQYAETPQPFLASDRDFYRTLHGLGVRHIADEIDTTPGASPALLGYRARLMWDLAAEPEPWLSAFCSAAYGPAADDMARYWRVQEEAVRRSPTPHPGLNDIARYTPQVMAASLAALDSAAKRTLSREQRVRVARARISVLMAAFYQAQKRTQADASRWVEAGRLRREVLDVATEGRLPLTLGAWNALGPGYELPYAALGGRTLVALPDQWLFRTDPQDRGTRERWFDPSADLSAFQPISTHSNWETQWPGAYDGAAWYAVDVTIPQAPPGKRVWLLFGAVDETWQAWIDGQPVGASTGDPGVIWDKPAACEITGRYPAGRKARLVVRVHDSGYAGGIWRPVRIVASD